MTNLFKKGNFTIHTGHTSNWSIDCSAFNKDDWVCIAQLIGERYPNFEKVKGVSKFGKILSSYLEPFATYGGLLLVDDVYSPPVMLGARIYWRTRKRYLDHDIQGFTIFTCVPQPSWVRSLWHLDTRTDVWISPDDL